MITVSNITSWAWGCGSFQRCPQILWHCSLQETRSVFPSFEYGQVYVWLLWPKEYREVMCVTSKAGSQKAMQIPPCSRDTGWPLKLPGWRSLMLAFWSTIPTEPRCPAILSSHQACGWRGLGSYRWTHLPAEYPQETSVDTTWNSQALLKILIHKIMRYNKKSYCFKF